MILIATHRRCHTVFALTGSLPLPILNVHFCLSYPLDKFIKNTIWMGLCSVLYFQSSSSLPFSHWNFCLNLCHFVYKNELPKTTVLFLSFSVFLLLCFSYSTITVTQASKESKRGMTTWMKITFSPSVHIAILFRQI